MTARVKKHFNREKGQLQRDNGGIVLRGSPKRQDQVAALMAVAADRSPSARQAIAWACAVGVTIKCLEPKKARGADVETQTLGSYRPGKKVINFYVGDGQLSARQVNTLVHEIRHMWHDDRDLLSGKPLPDTQWRVDPAYLIAQNALYEADASAHGALAEMEFQLRAGVSNPEASLRREFKRWFGGEVITNHYRQEMMDTYKCDLPLPWVQKSVSTFRGVFNLHVQPVVRGINPYSQRDLLRLGESFAGVNYMAALLRADPDFLPRMLQPTRLLSDYKNPTALSPAVLRIAKAHKREKLKHPKQRYPLPG